MGTTPTGWRRKRAWPEVLKREIVAASHACEGVLIAAAQDERQTRLPPVAIF